MSRAILIRTIDAVTQRLEQLNRLDAVDLIAYRRGQLSCREFMCRYQSRRCEIERMKDKIFFSWASIEEINNAA